MRPGSVLLYSGRTIHGGGANTSNEVRLGLNADYTLGAYALGYVEDVRHPRDFLDGTAQPTRGSAARLAYSEAYSPPAPTRSS